MAGVNAAPIELPDALVRTLQSPQLVLVTTMDVETKWPSNNLISWVYAPDNRRLRLAADSNGRILSNIRADDRVLLTLEVGGAFHTVEGNARVVANTLDNVSLKLGCAEVSVRTVRDITFWGGKITASAQWDVTYDKALKEKLDTGVFAALRGL